MPKGKRPTAMTSEETLAVMKQMTQIQTRSLATEIQRQAVQTYIGKPYGDRQCPVYLPQDPNVPHDQRTRCVRWGPHSAIRTRIRSRSRLLTKKSALIEVITEAYHLARCSRPHTCPNKCPHRMPTDLAVAVHKAVVMHINQKLDEVVVPLAP